MWECYITNLPLELDTGTHHEVWPEVCLSGSGQESAGMSDLQSSSPYIKKMVVILLCGPHLKRCLSMMN